MDEERLRRAKVLAVAGSKMLESAIAALERRDIAEAELLLDRASKDVQAAHGVACALAPNRADRPP